MYNVRDSLASRYKLSIKFIYSYTINHSFSHDLIYEYRFHLHKLIMCHSLSINRAQSVGSVEYIISVYGGHYFTWWVCGRPNAV